MTLLKNQRRRAGCKKKLRYKSLKEAQFEIDRALTYRGEELRVYECGDHLHLTAMTEEEFERWIKKS